MKKSQFALCAAVGAMMAPAAFGQDQLLIPDSTNDNVMLFSAFDGSLIDAAFIPSPGFLSTPINAISVGDEIWLADQVEDAVYRFDLDGNFIEQLNSGGLDNVRGIEFDGDLLYVSNSGTGNGAPGDAIVVFDMSGNQVDVWSNVGDPFDVLQRADDFLVNDIGADVINRFDADGNLLGVFDNTSGMAFPEQMTETDDGRVLVATFSSPSGIYEFDASGALLNFYDVGETGLRGVYELGNGNFLFTSGGGVFTYDPVAAVTTPVLEGVSGRFIEPLGGGEPQFAIEVSGSCPGQLTASATGATADGFVAFVFALETGSFVVPSGPCAGTELGLGSRGIRLVGTVQADANGEATLTGNAPAGACGGFLQAVDAATCATSNVANL